MWKQFTPEPPARPKYSRIPWDALMLVGLATGLWFSVRANREQLPTFPAHGEFSFDQIPVPGAVVALYPLDPSGKPSSHVRPRGVVGSDGRFRLGTYDSQDGAPAGEYAVTVTWRPSVINGEDYQPGPNVLPFKYSHADTTPLRVTLPPRANQLPPLRIVVGHEFDSDRNKSPTNLVFHEVPHADEL